MRIAITGGTGFLGNRLARRLADAGHSVHVVARGHTAIPCWMDATGEITHHTGGVTDAATLSAAFEGCAGVAHFAGINYERGETTYDRVHRQGTNIVQSVATDAGVDRIVLSSYLRARPGTTSGYLSSKWDAEQLIRTSASTGVVLKPAAIFGPGDQLLTHLARWLQTIPIGPTAGLQPAALRPVAVEDVVAVAEAALVDGTLDGDTVPLRGPETVHVRTLVDRISSVIGRRTYTLPTPAAGLSLAAWCFERTMTPPIMTRAGVRMLAEGMTTPAPTSVCTPVPTTLTPTQPPSEAYIERALGEVEQLGWGDLAWSPSG